MMSPYNHQEELWAVYWTWTALATVALAIRIYSRTRLTNFMGKDDWWMIAAWGFGLLNLVLWLQYISLGNGKHMVDIPETNHSPIIRIIWLIQSVYPLTLGIIKISILTFYLRLFPDQHLRRIIYVSILFVVLFSITSTLVIFFQCTPIPRIWAQPETLAHSQGKCIDTATAVVAVAGVNLFTDVFILLMPLKSLYDLQLTSRERIQVLIIFLLGSIACAASTARIPALINFEASHDRTWDGFAAAIWASTELNLSIITASLPAAKPFFVTYVFKGVSPFTGHDWKGNKTQIGVFGERRGSTVARWGDVGPSGIVTVLTGVEGFGKTAGGGGGVGVLWGGRKLGDDDGLGVDADEVMVLGRSGLGSCSTATTIEELEKELGIERHGV